MDDYAPEYQRRGQIHLVDVVPSSPLAFHVNRAFPIWIVRPSFGPIFFTPLLGAIVCNFFLLIMI
jgi:hypothetical protein